MGADVLVMQGARASATMILIIDYAELKSFGSSTLRVTLGHH